MAFQARKAGDFVERILLGELLPKPEPTHDVPRREFTQLRVRFLESYGAQHLPRLVRLQERGPEGVLSRGIAGTKKIIDFFNLYFKRKLKPFREKIFYLKNRNNSLKVVRLSFKNKIFVH